jgi:hypothetical protein
MTVNELRTKRATLWNTMEGFLDTHRTDKGVLSAEDDATYNNMEKELDALTTEIKRMERRGTLTRLSLISLLAARLLASRKSPKMKRSVAPLMPTERTSAGTSRQDALLHNVLSEGYGR